MSKNYYLPTRVVSGIDCIRENAGRFAALGKAALIVTGGRSAKITGALQDVEEALASQGIRYAVYDKVTANPTIPCAYDGAEAARSFGADFIVAIGGGSPMDAAKAMALLAAQTISPDKLFSGSYLPEVLPIAAVPTTAGTGSEVTQYSILTNDAAETKTSIATELIFPAIAFLDARYTESLPFETTVNTTIDALSHAVEGMLSVRASTFSDLQAKRSLHAIASTFPALLIWKRGETQGLSRAQRETLLFASTLAGMVIAQTGTTAVHAMGYSLTYFRHVDHGRANGLLLGRYLAFAAEKNPERVASILSAGGFSDPAVFVASLENLLGKRESIDSEEAEKYAKLAAKTKNIANGIIPTTTEDMRQIYLDALNGNK